MISRAWEAWIAENLLLGIDECVIIERLLEYGFSQESIQGSLNSVQSSASFAAASRIVKRSHKLEALAGIKRRLSALHKGRVIARVANLRSDQFLQRFYSQNLPLVMTGVVPNWPAYTKWTPDYLASRFGKASVDVSTKRKSGFEYQLNIEKNSTRMTLREYCEMVKTAGETNEHYLVANNRALEQSGLSDLMDDLEMPSGILNKEDADGRTFLWFGPRGTVTPLHHDPMNIFMAQIFGQKQVILIPPDDTPLLYNDVGVYSRVDIEQPDLNAYPLLTNARVVKTCLSPGDLLFIPVGWWHHVRSLSISIGVSFTNFAFPNQFDQEWATGN